MLGREKPRAKFLIHPFDLLYVSVGVPACPSHSLKPTPPQLYHGKIKSGPYSQPGCGTAQSNRGMAAEEPRPVPTHRCLSSGHGSALPLG